MLAVLPVRTCARGAAVQVSRDGQLLVDLFVNYDCDLESSNLFERTVNALVRLAQQPPIVSRPRHCAYPGCRLRPRA